MNEIQRVLLSFNTQAESFSPGMMALALLSAFIAGQLVAWAYMWSHMGVSYSRSYVQSLVLVAVAVALVMLIVGTNVFVAFGLFGAFAIIRFRNVLKDTRDTAFIFMELAVGLAAGTWNFAALTVGTAFFLMVCLYMSATRFGTLELTDAVVCLRAPDDVRESVEAVLRQHCQRTRLVSRHAAGEGESSDWSWRALLRDPARISDLLAGLRGLEQVSDVSVHYSGDEMES